MPGIGGTRDRVLKSYFNHSVAALTLQTLCNHFLFPTLTSWDPLSSDKRARGL